ncbi:MAG: hypothetical protein ACI857_000948 [Arenicella sp.]|jgi:hypothetical protein
MKKAYLLAFCFVLTSYSGQSQINPDTIKSEFNSQAAVDFFISPPLRDWPIASISTSPAPNHTPPNNFFRDSLIHQEIKNVQEKHSNNPIHKTQKSLEVSFDGQSGTTFPPDPSGSAGPNHYMQAVNRTFRVYDKTGLPLTNEVNLQSLWPSNTPVNSGDPIVMYDRHVDRWFISQLEITPHTISIGISTTSDPTGSYYIYTFPFTEAPDYPKYGIWWDGYYMTANTASGSNETMAVFEREEMLLGNPAAQMITSSVPLYDWMALPSDADGQLPPNGTPCYLFYVADNEYFNGADDFLVVHEFSVDWTTPTNSSIVHTQDILVNPFEQDYFSFSENIPQPVNWQYLDANSIFPCLRAQHMRWTGYNTIVLTHTVLTNGRESVRWYELRDADDGNWTVYQQGTYAPDISHRWYGAAAMDINGNIGLAYSICSSSTGVFPSLRYTGRLKDDPLNEMTIEETEIATGVSAQDSTNRYGDYSHLSLDPNGTDFWFTGEYMGDSSHAMTRIVSFNFDGLFTETENYKLERPEFIWTLNQNVLSISGENFENDFYEVDIIGSNGKIVISSPQQLGETFNIDIKLPQIAKGIYFIRIGTLDFQKVKKFKF